jgi:PemK-like, MazF-like toxin of type II toxin-antitoxin system
MKWSGKRLALPEPVPGLVLHYSYLWHDEHRRGLEEATKNRPCVVVLAVTKDDGDTMVTVVPVTHTAPRTAEEGVEIPTATKIRVGLDEGRSWIVVSEINRFIWPGVDLLPVPGKGGYEYGVLPPGLFRQVREGIVGWVLSRRLRTTPRSS